jgi:competence protein ComGC
MKSYDNITAFLIKYNSLDAQAQKNLKARLQRIKNKKGFTLMELLLVLWCHKKVFTLMELLLLVLWCLIWFGIIILAIVVGIQFLAKML